MSLSIEAQQIFFQMCHGMRLIVPIGDRNIRLVKDPRWADTCEQFMEREVQSEPVIELIRRGLISALPRETHQDIIDGNRGGKIGWAEMFRGSEIIVPRGAEVYACTQ